jgi:hypothetical protein
MLLIEIIDEQSGGGGLLRPRAIQFRFISPAHRTVNMVAGPSLSSDHGCSAWDAVVI